MDFGVFLTIFVSLCRTDLAEELLAVYHQTDYDVKFDIAHTEWYNTTYYRNVSGGFVLYNRTQRALNYTLYLLQDLTTDVSNTAQFYMFLSNEYRYFPLTIGMNLCHEYGRDTFGVRTLLKNTSNMHRCPWKKGWYYIYNCIPDISKLPPYIPRGSYKIESKFYHKSDFTLEIHFFGSVKDKPLKWAT